MTDPRGGATYGAESDPGYPPPPWRMAGQLWLSVFRLPRAADPRHPAGTYGTAFVDYDTGSSLTYSELLVARAVGPGRVSVADIWVDSPAAREGGRRLWAIPKELCDFDLDTGHRGLLCTTDWTATFARRPIASAWFTDTSRLAPRLPFRGTVWQPGTEETAGEDRAATLRGTSRVLPCRGHWDFAGDGPLAWLRGARQLGSLRMADFRVTVG